MVEKNIKGKENWIIGIIILIGAIIRIYFLNIVKNQAHWWDSLAYGSLAKNMISHKWDGIPFILHETTIRPPLLPMIWSWMLRVGSSDYVVIFLTGIIPSIISVYLIYLIGKEMYSKNVGLIAAFLAAVSWIHLFYSVRVLTDIPSMCLVLASIYFFIKGYNSLSIKPWTLSVLLLSLAVLFRYSHAVVALVYVVFLISTHKISLFKNKNFWLGGILGAIPLILFLVINLFSYGSLLPATSEYASSAGEKTAFGWYTFGFITHILRFPLFLLFYAALALIVVKMVMSYGFILKLKEQKMNLFNMLLFVFILFFYIFIIKAAEDRYLLALSGVFFIFSAICIDKIYSFLSKNGKQIAIVVCLVLLLWSAYAQLSFGNTLTLDRKESFKQMKEAFVWINHNTPEGAVVSGDWAEPYAIYYADRRVQPLPQDLDFSNFTLEADYIVLTAVHQPTPSVVSYVNNLTGQGRLMPAKVFFFDAEQTTPAVVIYRRV